jgi:hypothetical protein
VSNHNRLGDLRREAHHLKQVEHGKNGKSTFERALFLYKPNLKGRSVYIPDACGWKYLDPKDNEDVRDQDTLDFAELLKDFAHNVKMNPFGNFQDEAIAFDMARRLSITSGFMRCTTYSLVKFCQLLDITVDDKAIFQLLNFVQDGLREVQVMTLPEPDAETEIGDMRVNIHRDDDVISFDAPLTVRAGELKTGVIGQ